MQIKCSYKEILDINDPRIVPNPDNPNDHSDEQLAQFAKILIYQGQRKPIIISNQSGFIVTGHGTWMAAKLAAAKKLVLNFHYMKTFPAGSCLYFGIKHEGMAGLMGVAVFGKSSGTDAKTKIFPDVNPENIIEMQRLWISDALGANAESKTLSLIIDAIKKHYTKIKIVWTYAGGCKDDCGIVYQSSGFMFLGSEPSNDFYLTKNGEYKNLIAAKRFGKAGKGLTDQQIGEKLYGAGELVFAHRHYYFYPIDRSIRRKMQNKCKPFPKQSKNFRKDQKWVKKENGVGVGHGEQSQLGSTPSDSTKLRA